MKYETITIKDAKGVENTYLVRSSEKDQQVIAKLRTPGGLQPNRA